MTTPETASPNPAEVAVTKQINELGSQGYFFEACLQPGERTLSYDPVMGEVGQITYPIPDDLEEPRDMCDFLKDRIQLEISRTGLEYDVTYILDAGVPSETELEQVPEEQQWGKSFLASYKPGAVAFFARAV